MAILKPRFGIFLTATAVALVVGVSYLAGAKQPAHEAKCDRFEMVPMRDGVRLATYIWFPKGKGPWPAVLVRTPYGAENVVNHGESQRLLDNGYVLVAQDVRGRFKSEGKALAFVTDGWGKLQDGYDTVEWIAKQPWCNGKVGTWGKSAPGITQILMAGSAPPHLVCQHIGIAAADLYRQAFFQGGELRFELVVNWLYHGGWDLPSHIRLAVDNPTYNEFWSKLNLNETDVRPAAPMLNWSGWYDIFSQGAIDAYLAAKRRGGPRARNNQILIMGPWPHGIAKRFGEANLPDDVLTPPMIDYLSYFDYYLKGKKNEIANAKPVYYYTIGDITDPNCKLNRWRSADDWPPPCKYTPMYLYSDGSLSFEKPTARVGSRSFIYDPANPVPTLGGNNLFLDKGPFDNRKLEKRTDVLVYTSAPLKRDIEVTGRVKVKLFVSSSCRDTDFTAKLCDVYPDGRSLNVLDGIVRMSYVDNFRKRRLLVPGRVYEAEIDLWSTSWVFRRGHRIRVDISSSNYPRFETNPNTGEIYPLSVRLDDPTKPNHQRKVLKAKNTVYSSFKYPSRIVLPIAEGP
jgi:predicted acyl esterase